MRPSRSTFGQPTAQLARKSKILADVNKFIQKQMRTSHIYQPVMIRALLKGSGKASIRKIAGAFLINAMSCSHGCTRVGAIDRRSACQQ